MRYSVVNLGCKVNRVESDGFAAELAASGAEPAARDAADIVVVNTCAVTGEAEKKTRKAIRRALRENEGALVFVTGCAASLDPEAYGSLGDRVTVETDKAALVKRAQEHYRARAGAEGGGAAQAQAPGKAPGQSSSPSLLRVGEGFPSRAGIKVQDGCDNACSYCIVHVARGKAWSRPWQDIVQEAVAYERAGTREMVLTGINLGSYDSAGTSLPELLLALLAATEKARFRISSIEPGDVDGALIEALVGADGRLCRHLHLPLQSGSTRVLHDMARPYAAEEYVDLVGRLYREVPGLSLSTDVIVGFPGETDADFAASLRVARECRFSKIHVFPYSKREGTPAAGRPDQVGAQTKAERAEEMGALAAGLRSQAYGRLVGSVEKVLVETGNRGTTESYFTVTVSGPAKPGDLISMRLDKDRHAYPTKR